MSFALRPRAECRWEAAALGEVMLRFDPGDRRIHTARQFTVWEGGGEYNVVRGLRRTFGLPTALVTAIVDNPVGRLLEDLLLQGGVDLRHVKWCPFDGLGRATRNALNFTERGFGARGALGCADRGHSATSRLAPGDIDWERLFGDEGVRWFHTGGIFAALGERTPDVAIEAMECARKHGTVISYDLNYRASLWKSFGGQTRAREVNRRIAETVDVLIGNEEDFTAALGFEVEGVDEDLTALDPSKFRCMIERVVRELPRLAVVATTLRGVRTATVNDWGAVLWCDGRFHEARPREGLEVYDRVGGGDSFASGLAFAFLDGRGPEEAVEYGAAHGALAMTTPGDTSMATRAEVEKLIAGSAPRADR